MCETIQQIIKDIQAFWVLGPKINTQRGTQGGHPVSGRIPDHLVV